MNIILYLKTYVLFMLDVWKKIKEFLIKLNIMSIHFILLHPINDNIKMDL